MNKMDYLNQLESILKKNHLPKEDVDDIIRDYAEFFEEGRRQGQSDGEISAKLGSPELVVNQILEENGHKVAITPVLPKKEFKLPQFKLPKWKRKEKVKKERKCGFFGSLISGTFKVFLLLIVLPVVALIFGGAVVFLGACLLAILAAMAALIAAFVAVSFATHFLPMVTTVFAICLCICLMSLLICIAVLFIMLIGWCFKMFMSLLRGFFHSSAELVDVMSEETSDCAEEEEFHIDEEAGQYE